ncbi:CoA pyrophosphatase [Skermania sp. ID1734]|nr:CoA pyrophosphatase [Skermania sp. ID1734]
MLTADQIRAALQEFSPHSAGVGTARAAAVSVAVGTDAAGATAFLLTLRPDEMRAHPGQFALPGGRVEPGETAVSAALRELHEEVGLRASKDDVLGRLDDYVTRSGYVITPYVVWAGDLTAAVANPAEVATIFLPTMAELDAEPRFIQIPESPRPVVQWPFRKFLIHAPTGAMIYQFREVVLHHRPTRVDHLDQPVFAWR